MKKIVVIILMFFSGFAYAAKSLSTLKTLKFDAIEKQNINGREKMLKYNVIIEFPSKIRKEILSPDLNKGEIYIYDGEKKTIYLPIFDEYKEVEIDGEENKIIQTINKIRDLEVNYPDFRKEYNQKKLKELYIDDSKTILVYINEYIEQESYIIPKSIEIKDNNISLGTVFIENIEINPELKKENFNLEKGKK